VALWEINNKNGNRDNHQTAQGDGEMRTRRKTRGRRRRMGTQNITQYWCMKSRAMSGRRHGSEAPCAGLWSYQWHRRHRD